MPALTQAPFFLLLSTNASQNFTPRSPASMPGRSAVASSGACPSIRLQISSAASV